MLCRMTSKRDVAKGNGAFLSQDNGETSFILLRGSKVQRKIFRATQSCELLCFSSLLL